MESSPQLHFTYSLQDLPNQSEWYKELLSTTENHAYEKVLLKNRFISALNEFLKVNTDTDLQVLSAKILSIQAEVKDEQNPKELFVSLFVIFLRENCTGPSLYTEYVDELKRPLVKGGPLPENEFDPISNKNQILQDKLLIHFERDSEQIYHKTQFLILFFAMQLFLEEYNSLMNVDSIKDLDLWKARFYYSYDQQLTSSVVHLQDKSIQQYEKTLDSMKASISQQDDMTNKSALAMLLVEQSYCYLTFYKYKKAKNCIKEAMDLVGLKMKLTGRLGRRTKYQQFDIAQLVLDVENREVLVKQVVAPPSDQASETLEEGELADKMDQKLNFEEESILHEEPLITDPAGEISKKDLAVTDQLIIQAYINFIQKTFPKDETRAELVNPYITVALAKSNNWLVYSNGLLLRSRNEMDNSKRMERSLLQVQALIDQYRDKDISLGEKISYFNAINYPYFWQLQKELAKHYMSFGVFVSAFELLREVELFEDAIACLFMAGRRTQAEELANERLKEKKHSPGILCLLGDIKKDLTYYEKAWEESGHKYAKAMRNLGRQYHFQGEYQKSIDSYEKGLKISRLFPDAWFNLGCSYMRLEEWKSAIYAFGTSVSIDEANSEAWCNISTCYMRQDKFNEAVLCLEQALKNNRKNWKIWENYIILSIETMKFHKAIQGARELIRQDHVDRVNANLLLKISEVFLKNYVASGTCPPEEMAINKKQLYKFYDDYTNKVAKEYLVWRLIGRIKGILKEPWEEIKELKLKEIRALMEINWEHVIETCEKLERSLEELLKIFEQGGVMREEERVFIKNTIKAIEDCLHRKSKVSLE